MDDAVERLRREAELHPDDVAFLEAFDEAQVTTLAATYRAAKRAQDAELREATAAAFRIIPRPLRPAVKRVLFGGGR